VVTITKYNGNSANVVIPSVIDGKPVTAIEGYKIFNNSNLVSVTIPEKVTYLGSYLFGDVPKLTSITFKSTTQPNFDSAKGAGRDASPFSDLDPAKVTIYVPIGAKSNYKVSVDMGDVIVNKGEVVDVKHKYVDFKIIEK